MSRTQRLQDLLAILRDGTCHTAEEMARRMDVSVRTIYRDMATLQRSGVPVAGARGTGYRATGETALPPLTLTAAELEALNLGIAIVSEAGDAALAAAAQSLGDKLDAALPQQVIAEADAWRFETYPFANAARGLAQLPMLRSAIAARQKLRLTVQGPETTHSTVLVRPLRVENWGRTWSLVTWNETRARFSLYRVDLIETAEPLPELFADEPGKRLQDYTS